MCVIGKIPKSVSTTVSKFSTNLLGGAIPHIKPLLYLLDTKVYEAANVMWEALDLNKEEVLRELPFLKEEGFLEMAQRLNLPIGAKGHPLEEAHEIMAGRILEDYDKINTQNN